jgi:hypothetical protein
MVNPRGDERVSYPAPPGYHYLSQHDKVNPLALATTFSPNDLGMEISRFGDPAEWWDYTNTIDLDFFVPSDLHFDQY